MNDSCCFLRHVFILLFIGLVIVILNKVLIILWMYVKQECNLMILVWYAYLKYIMCTVHYERGYAVEYLCIVFIRGNIFIGSIFIESVLLAGITRNNINNNNTCSNNNNSRSNNSNTWEGCNHQIAATWSALSAIEPCNCCSWLIYNCI